MQSYVDERNSGHPSRLDDIPGTDQMLSIVAVAIITGDGIKEYEKAKADYFAARNTSLVTSLSWDMNFDDVKFGYWGDEDFLQAANVWDFPDLKAQKSKILSPGIWREMLVRSTSEPGLANGIDGGSPNGPYISIGGWGDLVPSQILSSVGCETILLVTRPFGAGPFQVSIEEVLNASGEDLEQLNSLDLGTSAWNAALDLADGTMCGEYDDPESGDNQGIANVGWTGPFVTEDPCLENAFGDSPDLLKEKEKRGCSGL